MDESRKQFEEWRMSDSPNSNLYRDAYGQYAEIGTWIAWKAWQASRAGIEIELPSLKQVDTGERYVWSDGVFNFKEDAIEAIRASGIKVKE